MGYQGKIYSSHSQYLHSVLSTYALQQHTSLSSPCFKHTNHSSTSSNTQILARPLNKGPKLQHTYTVCIIVCMYVYVCMCMCMCVCVCIIYVVQYCLSYSKPFECRLIRVFPAAAHESQLTFHWLSEAHTFCAPFSSTHLSRFYRSKHVLERPVFFNTHILRPALAHKSQYAILHRTQYALEQHTSLNFSWNSQKTFVSPQVAQKFQ